MERSEQGFVASKAWVRDIVFTSGAALTIALLGPYGTFGEPLEQRVVKSFALGFAGSLWLWPAMRLILRAGASAGLPDLFTMVAGLVVMTLPVSVVASGVRALFGDPPNLEAPLALYFSVLAMVLPIGLAYLHVDRWIERPAATPSGEPHEPRLLARLPARLGREVLALQAEDHYVRVHTATGTDLVLMRLADAIAEAEGINGLRVHRSWWIARAAVASARSEGRRAELTLTNGLLVPVTREAVPEIRRAGWL